MIRKFGVVPVDVTGLLYPLVRGKWFSFARDAFLGICSFYSSKDLVARIGYISSFCSLCGRPRIEKKEQPKFRCFVSAGSNAENLQF